MTTQRHLVPVTREHGGVHRRDDLPAADRLWSEQQKEAIRKQLVPSVNGRPMAVSDADLALFGEVCARTGLDPFVRQIYLIPTRDGPRIHIGVDGHRLLAARAGLDSTDGPYWCGSDGVWRDVWLAQSPPVAAKYGVRRRGSRGTIYAVALFREFKGNGPNWVEKPAHMLALVAERHTLRKAFQAEFAGVDRTVRDHGAELTPRAQEEPELPDEEVPSRRVDEEPGELLLGDVAPWPDEAGGGLSSGAPDADILPTLEEARARFREAVPRAQELKLPFDVPSRSADAREWLEAALALEERIAETVRRRLARGGG